MIKYKIKLSGYYIRPIRVGYLFKDRSEVISMVFINIPSVNFIHQYCSENGTVSRDGLKYINKNMDIQYCKSFIATEGKLIEVNPNENIMLPDVNIKNTLDICQDYESITITKI